MTSAQATHRNYDSLENKERIANMINEGGIGVEAHYSYETVQQIHQQINNTEEKDNY
ncbi:hypothetical protein [Virgibacillus profundi]|uniref:hypothetical protein n=1 Tax=Virgibacillus profundi TaxID=2024555 RepID=UPI0013FDC8B7|nr:hypothetical protein [Virgibacillus profundi]